MGCGTRPVGLSGTEPEGGGSSGGRCSSPQEEDFTRKVSVWWIRSQTWGLVEGIDRECETWWQGDGNSGMVYGLSGTLINLIGQDSNKRDGGQRREPLVLFPRTGVTGEGGGRVAGTPQGYTGTPHYVQGREPQTLKLRVRKVTINRGLDNRSGVDFFYYFGQFYVRYSVSQTTDVLLSGTVKKDRGSGFEEGTYYKITLYPTLLSFFRSNPTYIHGNCNVPSRNGWTERTRKGQEGDP